MSLKDYINAQLNILIKKGSFKKQLRKKYEKFTKGRIEKIASDIKGILGKHIVEDTDTSARYHGLRDFDIENGITISEIKEENGKTSFYIGFDKKALHRESFSDDFGSGVENVILLFKYGYSKNQPKARPYGEWDVHTTYNDALTGEEVSTRTPERIPARAEFPPNAFLENALAEMKSKYPEKEGFTIELLGEYGE